MVAGGRGRTSAFGRRCAALLLDISIGLFTCYIGWFIWCIFVFGKGQTPGKQLVGIYSAKIETPQTPTGWVTTFVREVLVKDLLFGVVFNMMSGGIAVIVSYLWPLWDNSGKSQTLHDKIVGTSVYVSQNDDEIESDSVYRYQGNQKD